jgi:hypothetical protein
MEDDLMSRFKSLIVVVMAVQIPLAWATVTYAVGTCEPKLTSFTSIQGALNATPSPSVVRVCPGTYYEQVVIGTQVTLEGISADNSTQAIIAVPSSGLKVSATNDLGQPMAAQVFVQSSGQVDLTNLAVDGTFNNVTASNVNVVGVFFLNSPGTLSQLKILNQSGNGKGTGIWLQGGIPAPSVTVENSSLQNFDYAGIVAETNSNLYELSATIKGNYVAGTSNDNSTGIELLSGLTASVSDNLIAGSGAGIQISGGKSSISKNTIDSVPVGIDVETDGVSVTSNTIYSAFNGSGIGIIANSTVAPVTGNTVAQFPIGILFYCNADTNVHSNTILDAVIALYEVPGDSMGTNKYYNVGTINGGGC